MKLPPENSNEFKFTFFKPEDIDAKFNNIIEKCKGLDDHTEICRIIHAEFYNQMFLTMEINKSYSKFKVYRVTIPFDGMELSSPKTFAYKPNNLVERNRANIKGSSVFYGAFTPAGALREMKSFLAVGKEFYISEWEIETQKPFYAHTVLINSKTLLENTAMHRLSSSQLEQARLLFNGIPQNIEKGFVQYIKRVGDLFALPGEEHYNITSAYAHKVLYEMRSLSAVVQMILYPSVLEEQNLFNFAIHPDFVDSEQMQLKHVFKLTVDKINENGITIKSAMRGVNTNGNIDWFQPVFRIDKVEKEKVVVHTYDQCVFQGKDALKMVINKSEKSVDDILEESIDTFLHHGISNLPYEGDIFNFESTERHHNIIMECNHGWQLETNKGHGCIKYLIVPVHWTELYAPIQK